MTEPVEAEVEVPTPSTNSTEPVAETEEVATPETTEDIEEPETDKTEEPAAIEMKPDCRRFYGEEEDAFNKRCQA